MRLKVATLYDGLQQISIDNILHNEFGFAVPARAQNVTIKLGTLLVKVEHRTLAIVLANNAVDVSCLCERCGQRAKTQALRA